MNRITSTWCIVSLTNVPINSDGAGWRFLTLAALKSAKSTLKDTKVAHMSTNRITSTCYIISFAISQLMAMAVVYLPQLAGTSCHGQGRP